MRLLRKIFRLCEHEPMILKEGTLLQLPKSIHEQGILHRLKGDLTVCRWCHAKMRDIQVKT